MIFHVVTHLITVICSITVLIILWKESRNPKNAVREIKGYCYKHFDCETCKYGGEDYACMFREGTVPADWEVK